jgi:molybdopterin/thiamine biosynthesis adenylyltransferase
MFVVLPHELLASWSDILANSRGIGATRQLWGRWVDGEDVLRLSLSSELGAQQVGIWATEAEWAAEPDKVRQDVGALRLLAIVSSDFDRVTSYDTREDPWPEVPIAIVRLVADYHRRHQGLFDVGYLAERTVVVVGAGTGGGQVAAQLARCGVGRFRLVDFDRLEVHNIARHVCDLGDLGRLKVNALADLLARVNPTVRAEPIDCNILERRDLLDDAIRGADLVVAATDSEATKLEINQACWDLNVPSVYGAAYTRGFGGDVFKVIPPNSACYNCFQRRVADMFETVPRASSIDYAAIEDPTRFVAEPGLGLDVTFIALLLSKLALLTLLRGTPSKLAEWPSNYVLWGNQAEWLFKQPLEAIFVDLEKVAGCQVCDHKTFVSAHLGSMTPSEISAQADDIIAAATAAGAASASPPSGENDKSS